MHAVKSGYPCTATVEAARGQYVKDTRRIASRYGRRKSVRCAAQEELKRETDPKKRVVITGMGAVSCFGNDVDEFYDRLLAGEPGAKNISRFDASAFPTKFAAQIEGFSSEVRRQFRATEVGREAK